MTDQALSMHDLNVEEKDDGDVSDTCPQSTVQSGDADEEPPFSIFTHREKKWISYVAAFGAMYSVLSSYIYFPALVPMAADLRVSVSLINLTVTSYMIMAGVAPAFMGGLADEGGRRPAYILMFVLVVVSNIGLALQHSYAALFVLRMVQSAGASGLFGAAYGIVADITTIAERGSYVGTLVFFGGAAPSFGPVIAGALTENLGWRWIFWFLVILTGTYLIVVVLLLPETQRKIVGNGSIATRGLHRSLFDILIKCRRTEPSQIAGTKSGTARRKNCHLPNPFKCVPMLFERGNLTVIAIASITYTVKLTLQMSLAAQCIDIYHLDYLQAGLIYLPSGVGGALAAYGTGKLLDWNLKQFTARHGRGGGYRRGDDISDFPIEQARFAGIYTLITVSAVGTAAYGVVLNEKTHIALPLIMQLITGATTSSLFTLCGTLLTDLNPDASATVQASHNLVRCIMAGIGIAIQQPLANVAGSGWCFGVFGIVMLLALPLSILIKRCGLRWRKEKQDGKGLLDCVTSV